MIANDLLHFCCVALVHNKPDAIGSGQLVALFKMA